MNSKKDGLKNMNIATEVNKDVLGAIYGLMFLFSSIRKLSESDDKSLLEQI